MFTKMKKIFILCNVMAMCSPDNTNAQSFFKKIKKAVEKEPFLGVWIKARPQENSPQRIPEALSIPLKMVLFILTSKETMFFPYLTRIYTTRRL